MTDLKFAIRQLLKSPGFTTVAVLSLALGIGAATAVFSLVNAILLRSLPVPNPHELRVLRWIGPRQHRIMDIDAKVDLKEFFAGNRVTWESVSGLIFLHLREQGVKLADIFGFAPLDNITARVEREAFNAHGMIVSDNFFSGLEARPLIGQLFAPGDGNAGDAQNVVITYAWWERYFGKDEDVLGKTIALNGRNYTVSAVLPREFPGVRPNDPRGFYVLIAPGAQFLGGALTSNDRWWVRLMARLKPGVNDAQLRSTLDVAFAREAAAQVDEPKMLVEPGRAGLAYDRNVYRKPLLLILSVVAVVMLVVCANIAGLSLARGMARQHELAVRAALGASRWRLVRQSLTESLALALLGGGFGVLVAIWGKTAISRLLAGSAEGFQCDFSIDLTVLGFTLSTALVAAVLSGLLPALRAGRADPVRGLKSRGALGAPRLRTGRVLVAAQMSLSLLLLTGAGLYVRTLVNLVHTDAGFDIGRLLLFKVNPRAAGYRNDKLTSFYERVQAAIAATPGVINATFASYRLLNEYRSTGGFTLSSRRARSPNEGLSTERVSVSETFFATMGIPIVQGRGFSVADDFNAPRVVVVNQAFVKAFTPDEDPIGQTIAIYDSPNWRIVGVCQDVKVSNIKETVLPTSYFPFRQHPFFSEGCCSVRTTLPPLGLATTIRKAVAAVDPRVPVFKVTTQETVRDKTISQERLFATLCSALAGLALLLSCIGLYGLMAFNLARRTQEIGVRMALGATRRNIATPILREAAVLGGVGVAVAVPVALAISNVLKSQLYGIKPDDPLTISTTVIVLMLVAVGAAWIPARRASRVNPMEALRCE